VWVLNWIDNQVVYVLIESHNITIYHFKLDTKLPITVGKIVTPPSVEALIDVIIYTGLFLLIPLSEL
jgi:hypothetical protein